jgi:hypothetical protein
LQAIGHTPLVRLRRIGADVASLIYVIRCRFIFSGKNDELTPDFLDRLLLDRIGCKDLCGSWLPE